MANLNVDDINVNGSTITSQNAQSLKLSSDTAAIEVLSNKRITGVGTPINASDVATKEYADGSTIISLQLDVSGFTQNAVGNNYLNTREVLETLYPVAGYDSGSAEPPLGVFANLSLIHI